MSRRGGRNKGGRKQMRANASKRRQTRTNASKRRGENASKRKQTRANVDKRKQTLTPPFIAVFYTPPLQSPYFLVFCNSLFSSSVCVEKKKRHKRRENNQRLVGSAYVPCHNVVDRARTWTCTWEILVCDKPHAGWMASKREKRNWRLEPENGWQKQNCQKWFQWTSNWLKMIWEGPKMEKRRLTEELKIRPKTLKAGWKTRSWPKQCQKTPQRQGMPKTKKRGIASCSENDWIGGGNVQRRGKRGPKLPQKRKNVIFCFLVGGGERRRAEAKCHKRPRLTNLGFCGFLGQFDVLFVLIRFFSPNFTSFGCKKKQLVHFLGVFSGKKFESGVNVPKTGPKREDGLKTDRKGLKAGWKAPNLPKTIPKNQQ